MLGFFAQERFYFGDNVLPCFESGIPLLKQRLRQLEDSMNVSVVEYEDLEVNLIKRCF